MVLARTWSGVRLPGGTAATVTPSLPNSTVDMGLMVAPFFGDTKKTRPVLGGGAGLAAGVLLAAGGASELHAATTAATVAAARTQRTRLPIAAPFVMTSSGDYSLKLHGGRRLLRCPPSCS